MRGAQAPGAGRRRHAHGARGALGPRIGIGEWDGVIRGYGAAIGRTVIAIGSLVTLAAAVVAFILSGPFGTEFRETIEGRATSR